MASLVTVVVPCFNYAHFLAECVESVRKQSYGDWECIIVDDGSVDDTPEVCARLSRLDVRVRTIRQANAGLSSARNTGIRSALGNLIQLVDADDLLEAEKLATQARFLDHHDEIDVAIGPFSWLPSRRAVANPWPRHNQDGEKVLPELVRANFFPVNAGLIRRSLFDVVGLFDEQLRAHEDWDFWLRCALRGRKFAFVSGEGDRALVRSHDASMSRSRELMLRTALTVRQRIHGQLPEDLRDANQARIAETAWRLGLLLMRTGNLPEGWRFYRQGLRDARRKVPAIVRLPLIVPGVAQAVHFGRRLFGW
jgi:glycosyltransferase involved in cell wall biosynthesis